MTRTALYLRQSELVSDGIDRQRARCTAIVEARGWTVVAEFIDNDVSASRPRGPQTAWGKMLTQAHAGVFDVVVAVDLDRLLRSTRDLSTLIDTGAAVLTVDGEIDLTTADGEFRATMLAGIARFEVRRKSERQVRANQHRASSGLPPMSGARPFGWEADKLTVHEHEAQFIRSATARVLAGDSIHSIVRAANADVNGPTPPRSASWARPTLLQVLRRPRNAGILERHGVPMPDSQIQPIVSPEDYRDMMAIISNPARRTLPGPQTHRYWLAGVMACTCGAPMRGRAKKYVCTVSTDRTTSVRPPGVHVAIQAHLAESRVSQMMWAVIFAGREEAATPTPVAEKHRKLAEIDARSARALELYTMPGADSRQVGRLIADIAEERRSVQSELDMLVADRAGASLVESVTAVLIPADLPADVHSEAATRESMSEFAARWEALSPEHKRAVVRATARVHVVPVGTYLGDGMHAYKGSRVRVERLRNGTS